MSISSVSCIYIGKLKFIFKESSNKGINIAITESAQCYECAKLFNTNNVYGVVDKEIVDKFLKSNKSWYESISETGDLINSYLIGTNYEFHRDSELTQKIYKTYSKFSKINRNKWNPGDIWICKNNFKLQNNFSNLDEYNDYLKKLFYNKELISVSLKKTKNPSLLIYNNKDPEVKLIIENIIYSYDSKKILRSKDTHIESNDNDKNFQLRSFGDMQDIQGELIGKYSAHGKIGLQAITELTKLPKPGKIFDYQNGIKYLKQEFIIQKKSNYKIKIFNESEILNSILDKINSKYQAMYISNRINDYDLTNMYLYATSQKNPLLSPSIFLKIF